MLSFWHQLCLVQAHWVAPVLVALNIFISYFCGYYNTTIIMNLSENIKKLREEKDFLQKQVAAEIGLKPAHYNKIEKGIVDPSVEILDKLAKLYGITIDQIVHLEKGMPKEVTIEDKSVSERVKLIQQLEDDDKKAIFRIIDGMLTKSKFKDFFNKNIAAL